MMADDPQIAALGRDVGRVFESLEKMLLQQQSLMSRMGKMEETLQKLATDIENLVTVVTGHRP
jgi:hypothetical protein